MLVDYIEIVAPLPITAHKRSSMAAEPMQVSGVVDTQAHAQGTEESVAHPLGLGQRRDQPRQNLAILQPKRQRKLQKSQSHCQYYQPELLYHRFPRNEGNRTRNRSRNSKSQPASHFLEEYTTSGSRNSCSASTGTTVLASSTCFHNHPDCPCSWAKAFSTTGLRMKMTRVNLVRQIISY